MKTHRAALFCAMCLAILAPASACADILALYDFETSFTDVNGDQKAESLFNRPVENNDVASSVYNTRSTHQELGVDIGGISTTTVDPHAFVRTFTTPNSTAQPANQNYHEFSIDINNGRWSMDSLHFEYWVNGVSPGEEYRATLYSDLVGYNAGDELGTVAYQPTTNQIPDIQTVTFGGSNFRQAFQNLQQGDSVEFRIVFSDNVSNGSIVHRIDDVVVRGFQVEGIPEPAAGSLLLLAGGIIAIRRRRQ